MSIENLSKCLFKLSFIFFNISFTHRVTLMSDINMFGAMACLILAQYDPALYSAARRPGLFADLRGLRCNSALLRLEDHVYVLHKAEDNACFRITKKIHVIPRTS